MSVDAKRVLEKMKATPARLRHASRLPVAIGTGVIVVAVAGAAPLASTELDFSGGTDVIWKWQSRS